ncbi:hypothetical protein RB594_009400 [Gaeumannomyces avenae]
MMTPTFTHGALSRLAIAVLALSPAVLAQETTTSAEPSATTTTSAKPTATLPPVAPVYNPGVGTMTLVGCYAEPSGARALPSIYLVANQTVETCVAHAKAAGATFAALEYGQECWYGASVHGGSARRPLEECNFPCPGDAAEFCGASNRLLVYSEGGVAPPLDSDTPAQPAAIGAYTFNGCVTEGNGTRALTSASFVSDSMTLQACATFCNAYKFFGVEYSRECYCGDVFSEGSIPAAGDCTMVCSGNGLQYCGAGNRLSSYGKP